MECLESLGKALGSVPSSQPCTAAAVRALHSRVEAAAQQLFPELVPGLRLAAGAVDYGRLREACTRQQLPGSCMPVLTWVADGLSSGLPSAVRQQALEVACMLLAVVSLVPGVLELQLSQGVIPPQVTQETARLLQQLGAFEDVCRQLTKVMSAVRVTLFPTQAIDSNTVNASNSGSKTGGAPDNSPNVTTTTTTTTTTSSSSSSSKRNTLPPVQQAAAVMFAWHQITLLMCHAVRVQDEATAVAALTGSGLYQVLLEGALLLLSLDPQAYSQAPEGVQLQLAQCFKLAVKAADILTLQIGLRVTDAWVNHYQQGVTPGTMVIKPMWPHNSTSGSTFKPWMRPLFKLQVLVLAKLQWDVRQRPEQAARAQQCHSSWPAAKPLTRAVRQLRSPCVAGDVLRQRAPGLVAHTIKVRSLSADLGRLRWLVSEESFPVVPPGVLGTTLDLTSRSVRGCILDKKAFDSMDPLDLALLLEVTELYCLVCPGPVPVVRDGWLGLSQAASTAPYDALAGFAATCGDALLGITEYLVEDVLLVARQAAEDAAARGAHAGSSTATSGAASSSSPGGGAAGRSSSSNSSGNAAGAAGAAAASSSSSKVRPVAGGQNPTVTLEHRLWWAQDAVSIVGHLMQQQEDLDGERIMSGQYKDTGYGVGVVHSLFTSRNAPRLLRLLEVALRVPNLKGQRLLNPMWLLPWRLPLLHIVASSNGGSRALLSAVTSAVKQQQVGQLVLSALIQSNGRLAPAAAAVVAAVPGRMGRVVAEQVLRHPETAVWQAVHHTVQLCGAAMRFMERAAALLDPVLAPLAAYLAATRLPPGQDTKPWAVEAVLSGTAWLPGEHSGWVDYKRALAADPAYMAGIMEELTAALSLQQAAAARKQASSLVKKAGGGAAEAEQLRQQLQGMWLGGERSEAPGLSAAEREALAAGYVLDPALGTSSDSSAACAGTALPQILRELCDMGVLKQEEVLAVGDPSRWSSALGPTSEADLRVASTALLAACKAAGAVAQLPGLLEQLQPILQEQAWGRPMVSGPQAAPQCDPKLTAEHCGEVADWALLLAPLLAVLLPAQQAAELQKAAAGVERDDLGGAELAPATTAHVLGLLGHVVVPDAPGCSYPGCCNMEGRSEAELPVQACRNCRGPRYCCHEHLVAHWQAGHKEVCRAAQAAAQQVKDMAGVGGLTGV